MSDKRYAVLRLDTLLFTLGGFAAPKPVAREQWIERLRKLRASPLTDAEIAAKLGTSAGNVRVHAHRLGLPCKHRVYPKQALEAQNAIIADLWMAGYFASEIGQKLGLPTDTVAMRVVHMKLPKHGRDWRWRRMAA